MVPVVPVVRPAAGLRHRGPDGPGRDGTGRDGDEATPGYRLDPAMSRRAFDRLTVLGRAAASRFNERRAAGQT
jgi:hypothetical protein